MGFAALAAAAAQRDWRAKLREALAKLSTADPTLASVIELLAVKADSGLAAPAATDGLVLYVNPDLIVDMDTDELARVLAHEALHVVLFHPQRLARFGGPQVLFNLAADLVVESGLDHSKLKLVKSALVDPSSKYMAEVKEGIEKLLECMGIKWSEVRNYSVEDLIGLMLSKKCVEVVGATVRVRGYGRLPCKNGAVVDVHKPGKYGSVAQRRDLVESVKRAGIGRGELEEAAEILGLVVRVDWRGILESLVGKICPIEYSYVRPSRRLMPLGITAPSLVRRPCKVAVIIDTSGSISVEEYVEFAREVAGLVATTGVTDLVVALADYEIQWVARFVAPNPQAIIAALSRIKGRGGTSFRRPILQLLEMHPDVRLIIYFTDGYGEYPSEGEVPVPVIWVISKEGCEEGNPDCWPPFGTVIKIR